MSSLFCRSSIFSKTPWTMITHFVLRPEIVIYLREPASQPDLGSLKHKIYVVLI